MLCGKPGATPFFQRLSRDIGSQAPLFSLACVEKYRGAWGRGYKFGTKVQLNGTYQQAKSRFLHVTTSETQESQPNIKMHNFRTVSSLDPRQKFILLHNLVYK